MSLPIRMMLAVVLLAGAGGLLWFLSIDKGATAPASDASIEQPAVARHFQSSQECKECHQAVWDEWYGSHHQIAYLNPEVRQLSDDFRNKECQACHLPRPVSVTGYGSRVLPRQTHPDEGVSCLTCHQGADGAILGVHAVPDAPCRPVASAELASVELCQSCHNQHQTTDQWRASSCATRGEDCNSCHMPKVHRSLAGGASRAGRSHRYLGAHDEETLRSAVKLDVVRNETGLQVTVTNVAAGHNAPTEERHRAIDVMTRDKLADGSWSDWERQFRFRQPYRDEPGENTQLPARASKVLEVAVRDGAVAAEVRLWYRLTPFVGDDDPKSTLLFEEHVDL